MHRTSPQAIGRAIRAERPDSPADGPPDGPAFAAAMTRHRDRVAQLERLARWHEAHAAHLDDRARTDAASGLAGDAVGEAHASADTHRRDAEALREIARELGWLSPLRLRVMATGLRQVRAAGLTGAAYDLRALVRTAWRLAGIATPGAPERDPVDRQAAA